MSLLSALSGETYTTRVVPPSQEPETRRSRDQRKAHSVLPLPVGATARRWRPWEMSGQAMAWTAVGSP